jgi:hypothetical protein
VIQRTLRAALTAALLVAASLPAHAQGTAWEDRAFVNLSFGVDAGSTDLAENRAFVVYGETGTLQSTVTYGSFPIFDITAGARVFGNVSVAVAYHRGGTTGDGTLNASVPHPLFFDRPRAVSETFDDAQRDESATHLQIGYTVPLGDKFDMMIFGGPSFFRVEQEMVTGLGFLEQGPPYTNITVTPNIQQVNASATGYNLGVDGTYFVYTSDRFRLGVGGMLRFTGATADLTFNDQSIETDLGGVQLAFGARFRF